MNGTSVIIDQTEGKTILVIHNPPPGLAGIEVGKELPWELRPAATPEATDEIVLQKVPHEAAK